MEYTQKREKKIKKGLWGVQRGPFKLTIQRCGELFIKGLRGREVNQTSKKRRKKGLTCLKGGLAETGR